MQIDSGTLCSSHQSSTLASALPVRLLNFGNFQSLRCPYTKTAANPSKVSSGPTLCAIRFHRDPPRERGTAVSTCNASFKDSLADAAGSEDVATVRASVLVVSTMEGSIIMRLITHSSNIEKSQAEAFGKITWMEASNDIQREEGNVIALEQ
jgi:hypothetical protein